MEVDDEIRGRTGSSSVLEKQNDGESLQNLPRLLSAESTRSSVGRTSSSARVTKRKISSRFHSPAAKSAVWIQEPGKKDDDDRSVQNDSYSRASDINPSHTMTVAHTRRNANGTLGSVYSGNKIRTLKKEDGIPLWRKDIQYALLRSVFDDTTAVFTRISDHSPGHTFADIYIDAMARSGKTSRILREKLLTEREAAVNMAMICLLVNVGRMNTTLNFFPEMRAQLRTYHSIPCLQAHQDPNAYKQLQDAPRLKSILKGACEDFNHPNTIEKIQAAAIPRTNPVNLIFVLSQYAPKISEMHFQQPRDFFDLVIRSTLSSRSRARAFLWLVWWYLESNFSTYDALNNPFGAGTTEDSPGSLPLKVPAFEHLNEEQANLENIDTEEEEAYGEAKRLERKRILEEDEATGQQGRKQASSQQAGQSDNQEKTGVSPPHENGSSDIDRTRSPSPVIVPSLHIPKSSAKSRAPSGSRTSISAITRSNFEKQQPTPRIILNTPKLVNLQDHSSVTAPEGGRLMLRPTMSLHRRPRPETSHQKAVSINRRLRIDNILYKQLQTVHKQIRKKKKIDTSTFAHRAMQRILDLPDDYDTEEESSWGPGGLIPNPEKEDNDYGGEALEQKKVLDRAQRRLTRADDNKSPSRTDQDDLVKMRTSVSINRHGGTANIYNKHRRVRGGQPVLSDDLARIRGLQEGELDDLDLDLLGEGRAGEHVDEESNEDTDMDGTEEGYDLTEDGMMG